MLMLIVSFHSLRRAGIRDASPALLADTQLVVLRTAWRALEDNIKLPRLNLFA